MATPEVACSLTDAELRERRALVRKALVPHIAAAERIPGRLTLAFTDNIRSTVEEFVSLEQQCCGFLDFTIAPPGSALILTVEGPANAEATLDMFAEAASAHLR